MDWVPVTFGFLTPLEVEAAHCNLEASALVPPAYISSQLESSPSVDADHPSHAGHSPRVSPVRADVRCVVNVFKWSHGRCRTQGIFCIDSSSLYSQLRGVVSNWIGSSDLVIFKLGRDCDGGVLPIADVVEESSLIESTCVFGANLFPRTLRCSGQVSVSFFVNFRGRFEFVAPPLVAALAPSWATLLEEVGKIVASTHRSREHLLQCDVFSVSLESGAVGLVALNGRSGPTNGERVAICLGAVNKGGRCVLNLPHQSVTCFLSEVFVSNPFLSVVLTSCDNGAIFSHPWIFDLAF